MPLSINDAGTWRTPHDVYVNDGGTWRLIQEIYVNRSGTWRTVFQKSVLATTMTKGSHDVSGFFYYGFDDSLSMGSLADTSLDNGGAVSAIEYTPDGFSIVRIGGFGANPGASHFATINVGGVLVTSASGTYSYAGGSATWTWVGNVFSLDGSGTSSVVLSA